MKIDHDRSYLGLWNTEKEMGITFEKIDRLRFQADCRNIDSIKAMNNIADWLENNFNMYQYKTRDNYGEHQLFFWSNGDTNYFTIDYNDKGYSFDEWDQWTEKIIKYIEDNYSNIEGSMSLQYKNCIKWDEVNEYIMKTEFDINNLSYDKLSILSKYMFVGGNRLSKDSKNKLMDIDIKIQEELLKSMNNKKVIYNGNKGTIKKVKDNEYGFFKPRATKTYYPIRLERIKSLNIA